MGEDDGSFDIDTFPHKRNVSSARRQIEAKEFLVWWMPYMKRNRMEELTHATDCTTRKLIGSFAVSGTISFTSDSHLK